MKVPTWILEKGPTAVRRRWRHFLSGVWEPSEWVEATPILRRPWGPEEGAHLYRFGEAMPAACDGPTAEVLPVIRRLWEEYPCFFLPRTQLDAWLLGRRAEPEVAALIAEIVAWPEAREWRGTGVETLRLVHEARSVL